MNEKKILAITMGDPSGVGPEIIVKTYIKEELNTICSPIVIGDAKILNKTISLLSANIRLNVIKNVEEILINNDILNIIDLNNIDDKQFEQCKVNAQSGKASVEYIIKSIELAKSKKIDGIVTTPINKASIRLGGYNYIGHTEIFADFTNTKNPITMLKTKDLSVVHVTRHIPLKEVSNNITKENILEVIKSTYYGFKLFGEKNMKLAVAGLNPHNGDGGLIGTEEIEEIEPAVKEAQKLGINVVGPIPADIVFHRTIQGEFDIVVAMYHDQGHIPIKTHNFEDSITLTLGLPILRTSVDHGTAFDIAWKGIADHKSLFEAIKYAIELLI